MMLKRTGCSAEEGTIGNERASLQKEKDETWKLAWEREIAILKKKKVTATDYLCGSVAFC